MNKCTLSTNLSPFDAICVLKCLPLTLQQTSTLYVYIVVIAFFFLVCPWPDPSHYSKEMDDAQKHFGPMLCTFWACNGQPIVPYKPKTCIKRPKLCMGNTNVCLSATRHILDKQKGRWAKKEPCTTLHYLQ